MIYSYKKKYIYTYFISYFRKGYFSVITGIFVEFREHRAFDESASFAMQAVAQEKQFNSICLVEVARDDAR